MKKLWRWINATRLRRVLSFTLAVLILFTSIRFIFLPAKEVRAADVYLGFDEGYGTSSAVHDTNGTISAGSITGATWKAEEYCKVGKCLFFDGNQDFVNFGDNDTYLDFAASDSFTITGWFRVPDGNSATTLMVRKLDDSGTDGGYSIGMYNSNIYCTFDDDDADTSNDGVTQTFSSNFDDNQWHQFACVKNATTSLTLYLDGKQVNQITSIGSTTTLANNDSLYLGMNSDGTSNDFIGFLDEVKIYRSARTADQIKADFNTETPSRGTSASFGPDNSWLTNGLVGYWKMDETALNSCSGGEDFCDSSGNTEHGTADATMTTSNIVAGKFGNGISFDGTDDEINTPVLTVNSATNEKNTVAFWMYWDGNNTESPVAWDTTAGGYALYFSATCFGFNTGAGDCWGVSHSGLSGSWKHIVAEFNNGDVQQSNIYINGVKQVLSQMNGSAANHTIDASAFAVLGNYYSGTAVAYTGDLDDVRIYNRALTPSEVERFYSWTPGPIAYWNLDENNGTTTAYDKSTNGKSLTINSSAGGSATSVSDTFTESSNTTMTSHTPDTGTGWTSIYNSITCTQPDGSATAPVILATQDSAKICIGTTGGDAGQWVTAQPAPSSATQSISVSIAAIGSENYNRTAGIFGRRTDNDNAYVVFMRPNAYTGDATVELYLVSGGSATTLGTWDADGGSGDGSDLAVTDVVELEITDSTKRVLLNDSEIISSNDNTLTSAGTWGLGFGRWQGTSTTIIAGVAHYEWRLDNFTAEETGTGAAPSWTQGKYGSALSLTGSNQSLSRTDDSDFDFGSASSFSYGSWIKHDTASAQEMIIAKYDSTAGNGGYKLYMETDGDLTCGIDDDETSFPEASATSTAATYDDNSWHHVMCVKDGISTLALYIDGVLITSTSISGVTSDFANADPLYVGIAEDGTSNDWVGSLDDIKIYNYSRSAGQVVEDMNAGHPAPGSPVGSALGYWKFDEGSDNTCTGGTNDVCNSGSAGSTYDAAQSGMAVPATTSSGWSNAGKYGKALYFDGTNDYIKSSTANFLSGSSQGAISAWVKPDDFSADGEVFASCDEASSSQMIGFFIDDTTGAPAIYQLNVTADTVKAGNGVTAGIWNHVVWQSNGSQYEIYINGVKQTLSVTSGTNSGDWFADTNNRDNITIGVLNYSSLTDYFDGQIDEVKVYNDPLTPDQIKADYNRGSSVVMGSTYTNPTGTPDWSAKMEYCPPGNTETNCAAGSDPSPIGHWKMDENSGTNTYDTSGYGRTSTTTGITSESWVPGKVGTALDFDGTGDRIDITDSNDFNPAAMSISSWFNTDTIPGAGSYATIIHHRDTDGTPCYNAFSQYLDENSNINVLFANSSGTAQTVGSVNNEITPGQWYHVESVWDGSSVYLYLNGELIVPAETLSGGTICDASQTVTIGVRNSTIQPFNGRIDNVQIFNYVRTPAQVAWDYNRGQPIGWWKMDESSWDGTTNEVKDSSGNANHGTASGTSLPTTATGKFNNGGSFNGTTTDYVSLASPLQNIDSFSTSVWIKPTALSDNSIFFSTTTAGSTGWAIGMDRAYSECANGDICVWLNTEYVDYMYDFPVGEWTHWIVTYDNNNGNIKFYINGKLVHSETTALRTTTSATTQSSINRGSAGWSPADMYLNGMLDDLRVFNYILSEQQVKTVYNEGSAVRFGPVTGIPN